MNVIMSDVDDKEISMDSSMDNSVKTRENHHCEENTRPNDIVLYKKLISKEFKSADFVLIKILRTLAISREIGDERVLLGSIAFLTVLHENYPLKNFTDGLSTFWHLDDSCLSYLGENFQIHDLEWFKLTMIHGYLHVNIENIYSFKMMITNFEILEKHCLTYTRYSYVAYKILQTWLKKSWKMNFWLGDDTRTLENRLEAIIFSNWDNCISEISRRNANQIFSIYLRIMNGKYKKFLHYIFENCMQNISWQNVTKYTILLEICKIFDDMATIVNSDLPVCIFTSLTKNHLKHPGTLLYLTILDKVNINEWKLIFGYHVIHMSADWECKGEYTAIELLWEQWMKPTLKKFPDVFEYLHENPFMNFRKLSNTYLEKIGDHLSPTMIYKDDILNDRIEDISETIRLNSFAIICLNQNWQMRMNEAEPFVIVKRFLYFNINASTISMRKGIIDNFKILFANMMKLSNADENGSRHVVRFIGWMHEFLLDCFEIGASYQRKILGLNLYRIILNFTTDNFVDGLSMKTTKFQAILKFSKALRQKMEQSNCWNFTNRESAIVILKLVLDQMIDVREKSASIIVRYFSQDLLLEIADIEILKQTALRHCDSSRFNEIAAGSSFMGILVHFGLEDNLINIYLDKAHSQLDEMRRDILKSAAGGSSFYGALTIILEVGLTNKAIEQSINDDVLLKILDLVEEATNFFLSSLTVRNTDNEFSPSFEDMSMAIEASIRNSEIDEDNEECVLSPAHQLVVSCIWMSLKVSCDLAAEIGTRLRTEENVIRSTNVIVSVLSKCRHKGAIEAAGLAIAKLTKALCKDNSISLKHLENLLTIDTRENINLTRRGAGLTIMFHRIVSSDHRKDRPFLHFAMGELLTSLKIQKRKFTTENTDYISDLPCARHLHCLRSLVADKSLQGHLVTYMEEVCLMCFDHLQSSDWNVRNASLQLFGAIVPRLVGQCSERELDYGTGNSIFHFVTHYPNIASNVMRQLEEFVKSFDWRKELRLSDIPLVNNLVPILTLLSKMSIGDCDLIDCSSLDYTRRGKRLFSMLLGHPVFHVRTLAAKSYAAFVKFPDMLQELAILKLAKIKDYYNNYNHGRLLAQYYLEKKYEHDIVCMGEKFRIRKHDIHENEFLRGIKVQLERARYTLKAYYYKNSMKCRYTIHNLLCYTISMTLLYCLLDFSTSLFKINEDHGLDYEDHLFMGSFFKYVNGDSGLPGLSEFVKYAMAFNGKCRPCQFDKQFLIINAAKNIDHHHSLMLNLQRGPYKFDLVIEDSLKIFHEKSRSHTLLKNVSMISDELKRKIYKEEYTMKELPKMLEETRDKLSELTIMLLNIDEKMAFPRATRLRNIGYIIAMDLNVKLEKNVLDSTIRYLHEKISIVKDDNDVETKKLVLECMSRLVHKIFTINKDFALDPTSETTKLLIRVATTLLTDEDSETRESSSSIMFPLVQSVAKDYQLIDSHVCSRANLYKILISIASVWTKNSAVPTKDFLAIFRTIVEAIDIPIETNNLRSPYEQDEIYHRDDTGFMNVLFYCLITLKRRDSSMENNDYQDLQHIDGIIRSKYELQRLASVETKNFDKYMKLSTSNYLSSKKRVLMKIIDDETIGNVS